MDKRPTLATASGAPVADNQNSTTAGPRGPVLMQDFHLLEKLAHRATPLQRDRRSSGARLCLPQRQRRGRQEALPSLLRRGR
jgi:hypothetical protein